MHTAIAELEQAQIRSDIPEFRPGDTLKVHVRVTEGTRSRIQIFQGVVIRRQGGGARETFTVRKISYGVGVERTFPVHSPTLEKIELVTRGRVRRAKLYYLRELRGKAARIRERRSPARAHRSSPVAARNLSDAGTAGSVGPPVAHAGRRSGRNERSWSCGRADGRAHMLRRTGVRLGHNERRPGYGRACDDGLPRR